MSLETGNHLVELLQAILREPDTAATVYFGNHSIAVTSAEETVAYLGILSCSTTDDTEVLIDIASITAIKALPDFSPMPMA